MHNSVDDNQFTALNIPETEELKTGRLDFLPSNFEYEIKSHDSSKNSDIESVVNFGNIGYFIIN